MTEPLWSQRRIDHFIGAKAGYLRYEVEDFMWAMRDEYEARIAELEKEAELRYRDGYEDGESAGRRFSEGRFSDE
jgi:hypothetical protein